MYVYISFYFIFMGVFEDDEFWCFCEILELCVEVLYLDWIFLLMVLFLIGLIFLSPKIEALSE